MFCGLIPQVQPPEPYLTSEEPTQEKKNSKGNKEKQERRT